MPIPMIAWLIIAAIASPVAVDKVTGDSIAPNHYLYAVERMGEDIQVPIGLLSRVDKYNERISELRMVENSPELVVKHVIEVEKAEAEASEEIQKDLSDSGRQVLGQNKLALFTRIKDHRQQVLSEVMQKVPEQAKPVIQKVMEKGPEIPTCPDECYQAGTVCVTVCKFDRPIPPSVQPIIRKPPITDKPEEIAPMPIPKEELQPIPIITPLPQYPTPSPARQTQMPNPVIGR